MSIRTKPLLLVPRFSASAPLRSLLHAAWWARPSSPRPDDGKHAGSFSFACEEFIEVAWRKEGGEFEGRGGSAPADLQVRWVPGELEIREKTMLKQGAQKGGPKGENKWLKHQSDRAGSIQMQFATFHENSKYHRKYFYLGSHFRRFVVHFSSLFSKSGRRGPGPRPKMLKRH